ncbi:hypothetical protein [Novosphingobium beihaiensis]|uniref:Uncharacterized protein n=1 Tax=Novosphingobium beihaiensis TaxID=2930389 RepID=A0ABT0BTX1_9SPHN|nr:hypothetical protein [Novosphingobium beihaiensis]MCJ2188477.1 hypothetical protein [Novosphingobium beihaiensis]
MAHTGVMEQAAVIAQWPEPETLTAAETDQVLVRLRRDRDAKLQRLRQLELQTSGSSDPIAFLDLTEARLELKILLDYWRRLLAQSLARQEWPALGSEPQAFADRASGSGWCSARALVPLTPDSLLFVHGPVTLWHAAALAEELAGDDDRIVRLAKCAFHHELTSEPRITVWDASIDAPAGAEQSGVAVNGTFETAAGRTLKFTAIAEEAYIPARRAGWHPVTAAMIARQGGKAAQPAAINEKLGPGLWPGSGAAERPGDVLLAKTEAIMAAVTQNMLVGERVMLLARVADLSIGTGFSAWLASKPELQFEFNWDRQKPIPGRGAFVPVRYRILPEDTGWQRTMFICLDSHIGF